MRLSFLNVFLTATVLFSCSLLVSCDKVDVTFGNLGQNNDPAISYSQDYSVRLQTLQLDSFLTSSRNTFVIGYNKDPQVGTIHAGSYMQLFVPVNTVLNVAHLTYDSLVLYIKSKASYYGDTAKPFALKVYRLTQTIQNTNLNNNNYFSTSSFGYDAANPLSLPGRYIVDSPGIAKAKSIRLSDTFGQDLLAKFVAGDNITKSQLEFENYFHGLYLDVDTATTNTIYSFGDTVVMRLYYTQHELTNTAKYLDFAYNNAKQFSHIDKNPGGLIPAFPAPINNYSLLASSATNNKAYLNSSTGTYIKISFPDILNLKSQHPYVKVISAQLLIPPTPGTFTYPNKLPTALSLYTTNSLNTLLGTVPTATGGTQTGDLFIDNLYGISTGYTYDITSFITQLLNPPTTTSNIASIPSALILSPSPQLGDGSLTRLIINDQNLPKGIQLKLYVLGL